MFRLSLQSELDMSGTESEKVTKSFKLQAKWKWSKVRFESVKSFKF